MQHRKILIVDDCPPGLKSHIDFFNYAGHICTGALDGKQGWDMLQKKRFDLLITVDQMPHITGGELLKRSRIKFPEMPVIITEVIMSKRKVKYFMKEGAFSCINMRSGYDPLHLCREIDRALYLHEYN